MDVLIQLNFYTYLQYYDYINLLLTNKNFFYTFNWDSIYKYYLEQKFSKNFCMQAKPIINSYYDCFKRIIVFEKWIKKLGYQLWEEDIYYIFWKTKK